MKRLDKAVNWLLRLLFVGSDDVYFHSQALREGSGAWGFLLHGRWWLRLGGRASTRVEWRLWGWSCGVSLHTDSDEGGWGFYLALPPVSLWVTLPWPRLGRRVAGSRLAAWWNKRYGGTGREHTHSSVELLSLRVHDWAVWWECLKLDWGWSSKMPWWMSGAWHPLDTLLGRMRCTVEAPEDTREVLVPMPEGAYPATVTFQVREWKRPRWPWVSHRREEAEVRLRVGIPHAGKGESAHDCGEDALLGLTCTAGTVATAVSKVVEAALEARRKYDGSEMAEYPLPEAVAALEAARRLGAPKGEVPG